jgi:1,4-dihydroxy-2-naphthoate octaprenyltransferase
MKNWIMAARPRTLILSLSCLSLGHVLAFYYIPSTFSWLVFGLSLATTLQLQILSNLANDLGDTLHGADHSLRQGPVRMVQIGAIPITVMKIVVWVLAISAFISGLALLFASLRSSTEWLAFLGVGVAAILAAVGYTMGKRPYGYAGLGDVAVFIFFGLVAVLGSFYLQAHQMPLSVLLPACSMGLLATAVLNVNNLRDVDSDVLAGKYSIPVRIGLENGKVYHVFLLLSALFLSAAFVFHLSQYTALGFLLLLSLPTARLLIMVFRSKSATQLDAQLKPTALLSLQYLAAYILVLLML